MMVSVPGFYTRKNAIEIAWREPDRSAQRVYALSWKGRFQRFRMMDANPPGAPLHVRHTSPRMVDK